MPVFDFVSDDKNDKFILELMNIMEIDPRYTRKKLAKLLSDNSLDSAVSLSKLSNIVSFKNKIDSRTYKVWERMYPMLLNEVKKYRGLEDTELIRKKIIHVYEKDPEKVLDTLSLKKSYFDRVIHTYKRSKLLDVYDALFDISHNEIRIEYLNAEGYLEKLQDIGFDLDMISTYLRKDNLKKLTDRDDQKLYNLLSSYDISRRLLSDNSLTDVYNLLKIVPAKTKHVGEKYSLTDDVSDSILLSLILEDRWRYSVKAKARGLAYGSDNSPA